MRKALLFVTLSVCLAVSASAQKKVRIGGGGDPEAKTRDWPKLAAKAGITDAEIGPAVDAYASALAKRDLFSGTILVAKAGKALFVKSYGLANKESSTPNTNDTKYNLGSINKIFTKVALLQLRAAGKLDLDQPAVKYLPDLKLDPRITVRQLLEHSSGLGDMFGPKFQAKSKELRTLADYASIIDTETLQFEPGTGRRYSNAGYIVLGLLVEKLSGMTYYDYVRTKIFAPAGMRDSDAYAYDEKVANRATGYTAEESDKREPNVTTLPARGSSAGGGFSTAADMLRFVEAARTGKLGDVAQAIGVGGGGWAGGAPGINAVVESEEDWVIVALSNYDPPAAEEVARNVRRLIGMPVE